MTAIKSLSLVLAIAGLTFAACDATEAMRAQGLDAATVVDAMPTCEPVPVENPCQDPILVSRSATNPCVFDIPEGTDCNFSVYLNGAALDPSSVSIRCSYGIFTIGPNVPGECDPCSVVHACSSSRTP